jgi:hypothetical protein
VRGTKYVPLPAMTIWRRLKLYGFGFLLGLIIVYALFGSRSCVTPNEQKMMELRHQSFQLSEKAACKLKCMQKNEFLLKLELRHFEVNYDLSSVRNKPCGEYYVEPKKEFAQMYHYKLVIFDCDTISKINDISIFQNTVCVCQ